MAPEGLCGSALIDAAAELLRHGILTPQGRLLGPDAVPGGLPPDLAGRLIAYEGQPAFQLAAADQTAHGRAIVLTQRDFRELQLASGAIRAGISLLLGPQRFAARTVAQCAAGRRIRQLHPPQQCPATSACCPAGSSIG